MLARSDLIDKQSFVLPMQIRSARLMSRRRTKLVDERSAEKNRLHKTLSDAGIRSLVVLSELHGVSASRMIEGLLADEPIDRLLTYADRRLKASKEEIADALEVDLLPGHRISARQIIDHIDVLSKQIRTLDEQLAQALSELVPLLDLLCAMPGVACVSVWLLVAEIGGDRRVFSNSAQLCWWDGLCPGNH